MGKTITIVGGGIIGLTIALQCQNSDVCVNIINHNPKPPANKRKGINGYDLPLAQMSCSEGNAGHFAIEQIFPMASLSIFKRLPKMLLDPLGPLALQWKSLPQLTPWLFRFLLASFPKAYQSHQEGLVTLNRHSLNAWVRLLKPLGLEHLIKHRGHLLVFENEVNQKIAQTLQSQSKAFDIETLFLDKKKLRSKEPNLNDSVTFGLHFTQTAYTISPQDLFQSLKEIFLSRGGEWIEDKVHSITPKEKGYRVNGCQTYHCDDLVVAAGARSHELLSDLGYKVPMISERGYHLMLPKMEQTLSCPVASYERSFIMTPMQQGLRLAGTVELAKSSNNPNYRRATMLRTHASALLQTPLNEEQQSMWMGCRPSLPDSLPVIDKSDRHNRLFFAFGHQHLGLTQAALTAELISQIMLDNTLPFSVKPYSINRF